MSRGKDVSKMEGVCIFDEINSQVNDVLVHLFN